MDPSNVNPKIQERQDLSSVVPEGSALTAYLDWALTQHGPCIYHLASALAFSVHEFARYGLRLNQSQPVGIWFALIGDSATGKSSAIRAMERFSFDVWDEAGLQLDPWLEVEGTISGLVAAMQEHYDHERDTAVCMLYQHELSAVLQTREPITEMLCRLGDGATFQRNIQDLRQKRKDDPLADRLERPNLSALFAATEAGLAPWFKEAHRAGGFFSRIWWIKPHFSKDYLQFDTDGGEELRQKAVEAFADWLSTLALIRGTQGTTIRCTPDAQELLREHLFEPEVRAGYDASGADDLNATRVRLIEKTRLFAAVYATMRSSHEVEAVDMAPAIALGKLLLQHAKRMEGLGAGDIVRKCAQARKIIFRHPDGISRSQLYRKLKVDKETLDKVVGTLLDEGSVVCRIDDLAKIYQNAETAPRSDNDAKVINLTEGLKRPRNR